MDTSDKMMGGNLRWTSIPSRESSNTPSRFMLRKPEYAFIRSHTYQGMVCLDFEVSLVELTRTHNQQICNAS